MFFHNLACTVSSEMQNANRLSESSLKVSSNSFRTSGRVSEIPQAPVSSVTQPLLLSGNMYKQKQQFPGCDDKAKPPQTHAQGWD